MNSKIFNGYRLKTSDLGELFQFVDAYRNAAVAHLQSRFKEILAVRIGDAVDAVALNQLKRLSGQGLMLDLPYLYSIRFWLEGKVVEAERTDLRSEAAYDLSSQIQVYCVRGMILFQIFAQDNSFEEMLKGFDQIEKFSYWNNTDRPDDMTQEQWDERGEIWREAIKSGIPANNGLSVTVKAQTNFPSNIKGAEIAKLIPPVRKRADEWAKNALFVKFFDKNPNAHKELPTKAISGYRKWISSDDGQAALEAEREEFAKKLPVITEEMIAIHVAQDIKDKGLAVTGGEA